MVCWLWHIALNGLMVLSWPWISNVDGLTTRSWPWIGIFDGLTAPSWPWIGVLVTLAAPRSPWTDGLGAPKIFKPLDSFHDARPRRIDVLYQTPSWKPDIQIGGAVPSYSFQAHLIQTSRLSRFPRDIITFPSPLIANPSAP